VIGKSLPRISRMVADQKWVESYAKLG